MMSLEQQVRTHTAYWIGLQNPGFLTHETPHLSSSLETFGVICMPAPISPSSAAASSTVTVQPARASAMEQARPPIPAPTRPTLIVFFMVCLRQQMLPYRERELISTMACWVTKVCSTQTTPAAVITHY